MEDKLKRGGISALLMSLLMPGAGLVYTHNPLQGLVCGLAVMLLLAADHYFHVMSSFPGMIVCLGLTAAFWLYSILASMVLGARGLSASQTKKDLGVWIVLLLIVNTVTISFIQNFPYTSFTASGGTISTLNMGERFLAVSGTYDSHLKAFSWEAVNAGDVVVVSEQDASCLSRIWGMAGDVLEVKAGSLYRNGKLATSTAEVALPNHASSWVVPEDMVFLWADKPAPQVQPDAIGPKHASSLIGKAMYIYWSGDISRIGQTVQ